GCGGRGLLHGRRRRHSRRQHARMVGCDRRAQGGGVVGGAVRRGRGGAGGGRLTWPFDRSLTTRTAGGKASPWRTGDEDPTAPSNGPDPVDHAVRRRRAPRHRRARLRRVSIAPPVPPPRSTSAEPRRVHAPAAERPVQQARLPLLLNGNTPTPFAAALVAGRTRWADESEQHRRGE